MRVELDTVDKGTALPPITTHYETGRANLAVAETEQRPTVLGLMAAGRMKPDNGTVTIDGAANTRELRRRVALIDAPTVSEPPSEVTVHPGAAFV